MPDPRLFQRATVAGRYRIERELGRGGAATVYLAHDIRHNRNVALKVLRPEVTAALGDDRFLVEIRTTAALQHPNILPLFDSGRVPAEDGPGGDLLFYVMPYVDGESLRDRLTREGQLPLSDALRVATAVADALAYAHRHGVIHRDIKPENILFHEGRPLVSDFGIAKALEPSQTTQLTETGLIIGTPQYMSPEQAAGETRLDRRTDIYALGCVLYEMLAGEAPHRGPTARAILAQTLSADPEPVSQRRPTVPAHVEAAVHTALQRLPADRFQTAEAFAAALADSTYRLHAGAADAARQRGRTLRLAAALATLLIIAALGGRWLGRPAPVATNGRTVVRLSLELPAAQRLAISGGQSYPFDLSRDGKQLVYIAWSGRTTRLFMRRMDAYEADPLPGTEGAEQPFFSPDGKWVGFFADGTLQKVPISGGAPIVIARAAGRPFGAHWGSDDTILFSTVASGLFRVPAAGGEAVRMDSLLTAGIARSDSSADAAQMRPRWPVFLPDGRHALVTSTGGTHVLDLATGAARFLFSGAQARYLPTGHLIYAEGDHKVRLVPFDLERVAVTGAPEPVLENVFRGPGSGAVNFAVSETGTLVYLHGGFERSLVFVDRTGREAPVLVEPRGYRFPRVSPDGKYVAVTVDPRPSGMWIIDLRRESATRLAVEGHTIDAAWSPDGTQLAFFLNDGQHVLRWREGGTPRRVGRQPVPLGQFGPTWSRDGWLIASENRIGTGQDLVALNVADGESVDLLRTPADENEPAMSPDGRWIAFVSDISGVDEVYVLPYVRSPAVSAPQIVSVGGGSDPVWSADGRELFYRSGTTIMVVRLGTSTGFVAGRPAELFSGPYDFTQVSNWDVSPDGRFLMVKADPSTTRQFRVVLNWFDELRAR